MTREIKSLDIGAMSLVAASYQNDSWVSFKKLRHSFLKFKIESSMIPFIKEEGLEYVQIDRDLYAISDFAFKIAYIMGIDISRPIQDGVLNPNKDKAEVILKTFIESLIGRARSEDAVCYFSVSSEPFDNESRVIYQSGVVIDILNELGYAATPINEGLSVVYSSLIEKDFTGLGVSAGCGLINFALSYKSRCVQNFSINRAGDWIDENVSRVLGIKTSKVTSIKEKGLNLQKPKNKEEKAIGIYYRELINHAIGCMNTRLRECDQLSLFKDPIDIVFAGGTSLPGGFIPILKNEMAKIKMPLEINRVYLAKDPLHAVAKGCFIKAVADSL